MECRRAIKPGNFPDQPHLQVGSKMRRAALSRLIYSVERAALMDSLQLGHLKRRTWMNLRVVEFSSLDGELTLDSVAPECGRGNTARALFRPRMLLDYSRLGP